MMTLSLHWVESRGTPNDHLGMIGKGVIHYFCVDFPRSCAAPEGLNHPKRQHATRQIVRLFESSYFPSKVE